MLEAFRSNLRNKWADLSSALIILLSSHPPAPLLSHTSETQTPPLPAVLAARADRPAPARTLRPSTGESPSQVRAISPGDAGHAPARGQTVHFAPDTAQPC